MDREVTVHLPSSQELVLEKETRIRESMFMMGLKQWILWASWYVKQFLFLFISIFIISILLKASEKYPQTPEFHRAGHGILSGNLLWLGDKAYCQYHNDIHEVKWTM